MRNELTVVIICFAILHVSSMLWMMKRPDKFSNCIVLLSYKVIWLGRLFTWNVKESVFVIWMK